jgi:hypothetical protein
MDCNLCGMPASYAYETESRGWSFRCTQCYEFSTPLLQSFMELMSPKRCYCDGPCVDGFTESE